MQGTPCGSSPFFPYCLEEKGVNVKIVIISAMICMYGFWPGSNLSFLHDFGLISLLLAHHWWVNWILCYLISLCLFVLKSLCNNVQPPSNNRWFCKPWLEFVPRVFSRVTLRSFYVVYILQHIVWAEQCVFSVCNILLIGNYFCLIRGI